MKRRAEKKECERIHSKELIVAILLIIPHIIIYIFLCIFLIPLGICWLFSLNLKGEPTGDYNLVLDLGKDKRLRYKVDEK